jgi:formylglycine-generating enzyme required for sulfatase activity
MSSVSIIHASRDEALGAKIAAALESAGHAAMRISADPDVGDLETSTVDDGAAIVVWTAAAAKLARLRDQAMEAMARGALIPVAVGGVRPPGGFENLPPVDLSGWTGAVDDPRWRFVLEEVNLAHQRTLLRDGEVWAEPQNENATENAGADPEQRQPEQTQSGEQEALQSDAPRADAPRPPAAYIDLDADDEDEIDADGLTPFLARQQRRRRRFNARQVALGASGGLVVMTAAAALLVPVLLPAPKPPAASVELREAAPSRPAPTTDAEAAVSDPSPTTPTNLAALRPDIAPIDETAEPVVIPMAPKAAPDAAASAPQTKAEETVTADAAADAAPAAEEAGLAEPGAGEDIGADSDAMENLIAAVNAETKAETVAEAESKAAAPSFNPATEEAVERTYLGNYFKECVECPDMAALPAGSFRMGAAHPESSEEGPVREVVISRRFAIGTREVTYAQWDACVAEGGCAAAPSDHGWGRGKQPVVSVSYEDAVAYANWLSLKTGQPYRLPTEAEWEYAARAGADGPFSFGDHISVRQANFNGKFPYSGPEETFRGRTTPAASFPPNAFGLFDMHGNAWEWTEDCWNASHAGAPADDTARETGDCTQRVLKGGAWNTGGWRLRAGHRTGKPKWSREFDNGFRVARDLG